MVDKRSARFLICGLFRKLVTRHRFLSRFNDLHAERQEKVGLTKGNTPKKEEGGFVVESETTTMMSGAVGGI